MKEAVERLRLAVGEVGRLLQGLAAKLSSEPSKNIPSLQIAERWRSDAHVGGYASNLTWQIRLTEEDVWVSSSLVRTTLQEVLELIVKSSGHPPLLILCFPGDEHVVMEIDFSRAGLEFRGNKVSMGYWSALVSIASGAGIHLVPPLLERATTNVKIPLPRRNPAKSASLA